ncbi:MAG: hypothetical protein ACRECH_05730 [Nitrososphaerales archaeon]
MVPKKEIVSAIILGLFVVTTLFAVVPGIHPSGGQRSVPGQSTTLYSSSSGSGTTTSSSSPGTSSSSESTHTYSQTPSESKTPSPQTCLDNASFPAPVPSTVRIALVQSLFTATAYYPDGFYTFYNTYRHVNGNITLNLQWLNKSVTSGQLYNRGWGHNVGLYNFLGSQSARNCGLMLGKNVFIISDVNVTAGALFYGNGTSKFNVIIAGFSEYATLQEYVAYKHFVAGGGTLILMDSDSFQVQVGYSPHSNHEWLILGHGWAFDGRRAWHSIWNPWDSNNTNWVGSNLTFYRFSFNGAELNSHNPIGLSLGKMFGAKVFVSYHSHEENALRNMTNTSIIAIFANESGTLVASYTHRYEKGMVICFCVFGTDIISSDQSAQYFLVKSVALSTNGQMSTISVRNSTSYLHQSFDTSSAGTLFILTGVVAAFSYSVRRKNEI